MYSTICLNAEGAVLSGGVFFVCEKYHYYCMFISFLYTLLQKYILIILIEIIISIFLSFFLKNINVFIFYRNF